MVWSIMKIVLIVEKNVESYWVILEEPDETITSLLMINYDKRIVSVVIILDNYV